MERNKEDSQTSILITALSIFAGIIIIALLIAVLIVFKNKDSEVEEKIASYQELLKEYEVKAAEEEEHFSFLVPEVSKSSGINPFESLKTMDIYVRNTPESHLGVVHFAYGKYDVNIEEFLTVSGKLTEKQFTDTYFIIEGHTDSTSSWQFNKELSDNRANDVKKMIVHLYGVDENRIKTVGYSWDRLLVKPEKTPEDKAANRRAEIFCFRYE
ncbi:MAG: OmpA family protein [Treponema sp.]|nr:OmpA family protein [Treponema sp.]